MRTLALALSTSLIWTAACSTKKASKAPAPPGQQGATNNDQTTDTDTDDETETTTEALGIELSDSSQLWQFPVGQVLTVDFRILGTTGRQVEVGLYELPTGARVSRSGSTATVTWDNPTTAGSYPLKLLVRDIDRCEQVESNDSVCTIQESDWGHLTKKSYDVVSESYMLEITDASITDPTLPSGNAALIQQVAALLAGNATGSSNIQNLLQGLSAAQLQQLLSMVQGGGVGGLDIAQLLTLVQGLSLKNDMQQQP